MDFVILDLEWNGAYSKKEKRYINEIFEFGAVRVNSNMELVDKFSMLIRPQIGKKICGRVKELTHISNEEIESTNNTYNHVIKEFTAFSRNAVILTWGITDIQTLITNNEYYNKTKVISFLKKYINLQSYCESCLKREDPSRQMGLSTAAQLLEIDFGGDNLHRALDDSLLSWECLKRVYDEEKIKTFIQIANADFYNKICFKNTVITDFHNPLVDQRQFFAVCPVCGRKGRRLTPWQSKNKHFRALFCCDSCKEKFYGRVQFKLKYEGVQVKHSAYPCEPAEAESTAAKLSGG